MGVTLIGGLCIAVVRHPKNPHPMFSLAPRARHPATLLTVRGYAAHCGPSLGRTRVHRSCLLVVAAVVGHRRAPEAPWFLTVTGCVFQTVQCSRSLIGTAVNTAVFEGILAPYVQSCCIQSSVPRACSGLYRGSIVCQRPSRLDLAMVVLVYWAGRQVSFLR